MGFARVLSKRMSNLLNGDLEVLQMGANATMRRRHPFTLFLLLGIMFLVSSCDNPETNPSSAATPDLHISEHLATVKEFLRGLRENDTQALRAVVVQEAWPRIDAWVAEHEPVHCPVNWSLFELLDSYTGPFTASAPPDKERPDIWSGRVHDWLRCDKGRDYAVYNITASTVTTVYTDGQWMIVDWDGVEERHD